METQDQDKEAQIIEGGYEKKEETVKKKPPALPPPILLIDALKRKYRMSFTKERTMRWAQKLKEQDIEYIHDLLSISASALRAHSERYTTGLFGLLTAFKEHCTVFEIRIKSKIEGTLPVNFIEGYYIDCSDIVNGQRLFVNVRGIRSNVDEQNQFVIYATKSKRWAIHRARYIPNDYAWIQCSDESTDDLKTMMMMSTQWRYYRTKMDNRPAAFEPIDLDIKYWN
eukprot:337037_1